MEKIFRKKGKGSGSVEQGKTTNPTEGFHSLITKRAFLKLCGAGICAFCFPSPSGSFGKALAQAPQKGLVRTKLSPLYKPLGGGAVGCELCPRECRIPLGRRGFCKVRENRDGKLFSLVCGNPCAIHLDPIEKKPLFHVLPSSTTLSIATAGCNLHCKFCQNWEFSQASPEEVYSYDAPPELIVRKAKEMGARSIAHTYVEPTVFYEYMLEVGGVARQAGLMNVMHSNGFINPAPLQNLCRILDAANIDLKAFSESFYQELCSGALSPVLDTLKTLKEQKIHVEITNLVIPTKNDDLSEIQEMCLWIKKDLGQETPLHFSRFYPLYQLTKIPPTPVSVLEKAREVALSTGLEYVYIGNVPGHEAWNTYCPGCKKPIIQRTGYMIREIRMKEGKCGYCGRPIPGIWEKLS
jgi:pyruvate formate lyase activating enzyme